MVSADKKIDAMRANPKAGWRMADLETVARAYGITVSKPGGSHFTFRYEGATRKVTVPYNRPIKPPYIREFIALIDEIRE